MKQVSKITIILVVMVLFGCSKDDNPTSVVFNENVSDLKFEKQQLTEDVPSLITKFINKDQILNQQFNTIETSRINHTYVLSNGADNLTRNVSLTNNQINLATLLLPKRSYLLFRAFVTKKAFRFKGIDLNLSKIQHEDEGSSSFFVTGVISETNELVKFYYNTQSGIEYWLIAPSGDKVLDISLLIGLWSFDSFGGLPVTNDYGAIKYEYKADRTLVIYNWVDNIEQWGTWSVNSDNTVIITVLTKEVNMLTRGITNFNKRDERKIFKITKTQLILLSKWGHLGKMKGIFSRV